MTPVSVRTLAGLDELSPLIKQLPIAALFLAAAVHERHHPDA